MKAYLYGLQPSGRQHLGNDFGAIRRHLALSRVPDSALMAKVPGVDGEKMGMSYGNEIWIFVDRCYRACGIR